MARKNAGATASKAFADVYTVPAGFAAEVGRLTLVGNPAVRDKVVTVVWHDDSEDTDNTIGKYPLHGDETVDVEDAVGLVLEEADVLKVSANEDIAATVSLSVEVTGSEGAPLSIFSATCPAIATIGNDGTVIVGVCPYAGTITDVTWTPGAAVTGVNTHTRKLELVNKKADATGSAKPASVQFNLGTDAAAFIEKALTLSGTADDLAVEAGDVLAFVSTHVGNGIADPGGLVTVTIDKA